MPITRPIYSAAPSSLLPSASLTAPPRHTGPSARGRNSFPTPHTPVTPHHPPLVPLAVSVGLILLLCGPAAATECLPPDWQCCPDQWSCLSRSGVLTLDLDYDFEGPPNPDGSGNDGAPDGRLSRHEIQCAIDCLDGDLAQEHTPVAQAPPDGQGPDAETECADRKDNDGDTFTDCCEDPSLLAPDPANLGGVVRFAPGLEYFSDGPIKLPIWSHHPLILQGNGAVITVPPLPHFSGESFALIELTMPPGANEADVDAANWYRNNWRIENLTLTMDPSFPHPAGTFYTGIEIHGSYDMTISGCRFENLDVGIAASWWLSSSIQDCSFANNKRYDILLTNNTYCFRGDEGDGELTDPCYLNDDQPTSVCWPGVAPDATQEAAGAGASRIYNTIHQGTDQLVTTGTRPVGIMFRSSPNLSVDGAYFTGNYSDACIAMRTHQNTRGALIRDCTLDLLARDPAKAPLQLLNAGMLVIDGIQDRSVIAPGPTLPWIDQVLYAVGGDLTDTHAAEGGRTTLMNIHPLPRTRTIDVLVPSSRDPNRHTFSFLNVSSAVPPFFTDPVAGSARWTTDGCPLPWTTCPTRDVKFSRHTVRGFLERRLPSVWHFKNDPAGGTIPALLEDPSPYRGQLYYYPPYRPAQPFYGRLRGKLDDTRDELVRNGPERQPRGSRWDIPCMTAECLP